MPPERGAQAVWFGEQPGSFGMLHEPAGPPATTGVVIVPPFGWEEMACYPTRGRWADELAAAGRVALRLDLPGTGDSPGGPGDDDLLGAWCDAVAAAAGVLAGRGCERVAALGLGFGGLVLLAAVDRGAAIDDIVLWGTPVDGRGFVRGERAFSRMQTSSLGSGPDELLPDGWLQSGGYLLSGQTQDALTALKPARLRTGTVRRALLLDKDGMAPDGALADALRAGGAEVEIAPGRGYSALMATPEQSRLTPATTELVERWLAAGATPGAERAAVATRDSTVLQLGGVAARESAVRLETPSGVVFGVLTEPVDGAPPTACVVLLSAWAERRSGPNRLWTEAARRCAARGMAALRVDLPGVGDATGDPSWAVHIEGLHDPRHVPAVRAVLDGLEAAGTASRFVLAGLSSGGYWGFCAGTDDERVIGVLAMNADGVLTQGARAAIEHSARKAGRIFQLRWWLLVLRGEVKPSSVLRVVGSLTRVALTRVRRAAAPEAEPKPSTAVLEEGAAALSARGGKLIVACTASEPLHRELVREGAELRLQSLPGVQVGTLPTLDHNLRPYEAQQAALDELDRLMTAVEPALAG